MMFGKWEQYLDSRIELIPVELAGRGRRIGEALYGDLPDAIEDVFQLVKEEICLVKDDICASPYALFGHSMGGLIAYELAQKIQDHELPPPVHIFFSGQRAPHIIDAKEKKYCLMDDLEFRRELIELGGTPPEFFEIPELVDTFLPLLRNDFRLAETETHQRKIRPLDVDFSVFLGKDDDLTPEQGEGWKQHTRQDCRIHYFDGGHFFLNDLTEQLVKLINDSLLFTGRHETK